MRIQELLEAVPVGTSTQVPVRPTIPPERPSDLTPQPAPTLGNQTPAGAPAVAGQPPAGQPVAPAVAGQPPAGQPAPLSPAIQQGMKSTMTDLDKIAAQIVGLKQKQQQMQQQIEKPVP